MSDDDRALAHLRRKPTPPTSPHGVPIEEQPEEEDSLPIIIAEDGGDTPVETPRGQRRRKRVSTQEFAENTWNEIRALRRRLDNLASTDANGILAVTQRLAVLEERMERALGLGESLDDLRAIGMQLAELRVSLFGLDGTNGKMGNLRKDVDAANTRADAAPKFVKRALVWAAGGILGSLVPAVLFLKNANEAASDAKAAAAAERASVHAELEAGKADRAFLHQQLDSMLRLLRVRASSTSTGDPSP